MSRRSCRRHRRRVGDRRGARLPPARRGIRRRVARPRQRLRRLRPRRWDAVEPVDVACLNAGVLGGPPDPAELTLEGYRRAIARERRRRGPRRAALGAGHAGRRPDRLHRVARGADRGPGRPGLRADEARRGRVRPQRRAALAERGISINAVCPGFADTPMVAGHGARAARCRRASRCSTTADVAEAAWVALSSGETGHAWAVQPGRPPIDFRFPRVPGPRTAGTPSGMPSLAACRLSVAARVRRTTQPSPSRNERRIRRATTMRCTSSGPS